MNICLYPGGINHLKMGGIKTAYENKIYILTHQHISYTLHPRKGIFDILHLEFPSPQSVWYALRAQKQKKKIVMSTHVTVEDYKNTFRFSNYTTSLIEAYLKKVYSCADLLIAPSTYTKSLIRKYGIDCPIEVISNGIHPSYLHGKKHENNKTNNHPVIGTAGYVTKRKGIQTFCHIADHCPTWDFKWAGSFHQDLLYDVNEIATPINVEFLGYVENIKDTYQQYDAFLFPSYEENQGIVLLEAASFGLPLIVRDLPVYSEWLVHGENCLKCSSDDEFIESLRKLFSQPDLYEKLQKNARLLAEQNSLEYIGNHLIQCYKKLLE